MIETRRLHIKPLSKEELKIYVNSPTKLALALDLKVNSKNVKKASNAQIKHDLLPGIDDSSEDFLYYTMWIIIEKTKKAIVGGICFHGAPNKNKEVEIGYSVNKEYRNQGIMTETISGIINWVKQKKEIKYIKAKTDSKNYPSIKSLQKNNFKLFKTMENFVVFRLNLKK